MVLSPINIKVAWAFLLFALAAAASAQNYPVKPVRLMVAFSAGSGTDTIGRIMASGLSEAFGQQVIVENRSGASGNIGAEIAAKAAPDGYTLLLANIGLAANMTFFNNLSYDLVRDFAPISQIASAPGVVAVHPSLPVRSVGDLVRLAKGKPGAINYSSGGRGTAMFMATELFKSQAAIDLVEVGYRSGSEALTALVAGEVPIHFTTVAQALPYVRQGRLRVLAVTSSKRVPSMPQTPTMMESGYPSYEFGNWYGLMAPAKTPRDTIAVIRAATVTALNSPTLNKRLIDLGYVVIGDQPEQYGAFLRAEIDKLGRIIKALNLKPE